jgi:hypothetical protein
MNASTPALPANPFAALVSNPCAAKDALTAALYQLLAGQGVAEVAFETQTLRFQRAAIPELRAEIARLTAICDARRGVKRTVRVGPHARWTARRSGYGYLGY